MSLRERGLLLSTARDCLDHLSFTALPYAMRLLEVIASSREQSRTFPLQFGWDCKWRTSSILAVKRCHVFALAVWSTLGLFQVLILVEW